MYRNVLALPDLASFLVFLLRPCAVVLDATLLCCFVGERGLYRVYPVQFPFCHVDAVLYVVIDGVVRVLLFSSPGVWHEWVDEVKEICAAGDLKVVRVHTHIGSGSDPAVWQKVSRMSLELVRQFPDVVTLNLGGGYKVSLCLSLSIFYLYIYFCSSSVLP